MLESTRQPSFARSTILAPYVTKDLDYVDPEFKHGRISNTKDQRIVLCRCQNTDGQRSGASAVRTANSGLGGTHPDGEELVKWRRPWPAFISVVQQLPVEHRRYV